MTRIAAVQFAPEFGIPDYNLDRALSLARVEDADLFVMPELCTSGYQFVDRREAERFAEEVPDGPTTDRLCQFARRMRAWMVCGLPEIQGDRLFNSAVITGPDGFVGVYRKTHLFRREKEIFDPGDTGFQVFDMDGLKFGVMICFDWIFPESARALALKGADVIVAPSNLILPWAQRAMVIRSLENRVFTILTNRHGDESRGGLEPLRFTGASQITAPSGEILAALESDVDAVAVAEIDVKEARDKLATPENDVLADRRPSFYRSLTS